MAMFRGYKYIAILILAALVLPLALSGCSQESMSKPVEVVSATGPLEPSVPAGPRVEITLKNASDEPVVYPITIFNNGTTRIDELLMEYDQAKFGVSPSRAINLEPNETAHFNLTAKKGSLGVPTRGVVIASAGETYEYLLLEVGFTTNEDNVETTYAGDDDDDRGYYCSELGGIKCSGGDVCSVEEQDSLSGLCCVGGVCEAPSGGSKAWIGFKLLF